MLIWQSCVNANIKPAVAWAAEDGEVAVCIGLSWWGCWEEMGGQLSRDHPKQGPNSQLEGLRRRHVALTDQILQIAQGRTGCPLADGRISPAVVSPPPLSYISLQTHSLTSNLTPCLRCLFILLSVFCLASLPGPRRCLKSYTLHIRPWTWTAARISSTPLPWLWLLLLLFSSVIQ